MGMTKTYVTFGQSHAHAVNGRTFDKDCVAVIHHSTSVDGRALAFEIFGQKFCFEYPEEHLDQLHMHHFPRGFINVNENDPVTTEGDHDSAVDFALSPMVDGVLPLAVSDMEREGLVNLLRNSDGTLSTDGNI